ncbi:M23 family metallopeptidase [Bacillus sp. REN10]|uniref:M23 family metallopeptidase n=1 Tax=Bacillus sp. REN10 TaxID=2782541 RepID=UPI00193B1A55|nr:M23 family metallopeptidase [Bacillus sp. REN10]
MRKGEKKPIPQKIQQFFKKRWVFPAVYLMSAALLISGIIWYQMAGVDKEQGFNSQEEVFEEGAFDQPAEEVNSTVEEMIKPVKNADEMVVKTGFYEEKASEKDQEASLVIYNNTYQPNTGIAFGMKNDQTFAVVAALSGKVTKVMEDSLLGNVIEIEHANGIVTSYQSVKDMKVAEGDTVSQGDVIAKAGKSLFNEKAGVHVHFEVRKDQMALNPQNFFGKPLSAIQEAATPDEDKTPETDVTDETSGTDNPDSGNEQLEEKSGS